MGNEYTKQLVKSLTEYAENKRGLESLGDEIMGEYLDNYSIERFLDNVDTLTLLQALLRRESNPDTGTTKAKRVI